jgi:hypothetical protein
MTALTSFRRDGDTQTVARKEFLESGSGYAFSRGHNQNLAVIALPAPTTRWFF